MGNIRSKCKKTAKISFILSLIISLLMLVLLSTGENEISSIIFAFIFTLITVFIIIFTIIFCIHLMIYGLSILKESKAYNQYFKKLKDVIEKIRKKNVKLCQKCNKELGGFFTGKWRSVKGEKYCLDCAKKIEGKREHDGEEHKKNNGQSGELCPKCRKDLGGFFSWDWGYHSGKKYCKPCLKKERENPEKILSNSNHIADEYCRQCGAMKKGKYCHECGTEAEERCKRNLMGSIIKEINKKETIEDSIRLQSIAIRLFIALIILVIFLPIILFIIWFIL